MMENLSSERRAVIRIGPAGWSYQDWEGIVYPPNKGAKFDPLTYLADIFDTIELNNTFYHPPTPRISLSWANRVHSSQGFKFTVKLYRNFTHERQTLSLADEKIFKNGIEPLSKNDRLGALLLQFPYSFHQTGENRSYLQQLADKFREYPLVLEVRHGSWNRPWVYEFLKENWIGFCNIDQPQVAYSIGATKRVTGPVGYLRLHGINSKAWFSESGSRDAGYDYLYNEVELSELMERVRLIAGQVEEFYVITNNHFRGQAVCNALEIKVMAGEKKIMVPAIICQHYPRLKKIMNNKELAVQAG